MEFEYTNYIFIDEIYLDEMAEEVVKGTPADIAVDNYAAGCDDAQYYAFDFVKDAVAREVKKRAEMIRGDEKNVD